MRMRPTLIALLLASCSSVDVKPSARRPDRDRLAIRAMNASEQGLEAEEVKTFAQHIVDRAAAVLGGKEPTDKRGRLLKEASDVAKLAIASADASIAVTPPDPAKSEALLAKARGFLDTAATRESEANAAFRILYSPWFRSHAGAATVSPYTIERRSSDGRYALASRGSTTTFYAEADFLHRTAWLDPADRLYLSSERAPILPRDYELRAGFINTQSVDSSSRAASGDWFVDASLGWNVFHLNLKDEQRDVDTLEPRATINLELNGGFVTDRSGLHTSGYYQVGPAVAASVPIRISEGVHRSATAVFGTYYGIHEYPRVDFDDVVYSTRARPAYNQLGSLGIKMDLAIPLTGELHAVIQGRHASVISRTDVADDWSLFIGVSVPIGKMLRNLLTADDT